MYFCFGSISDTDPKIDSGPLYFLHLATEIAFLSRLAYRTRQCSV